MTGSPLGSEQWLSSTGFSFCGAAIFAAPAALLLHRDGFSMTYHAVAASGFGLGMVIGRTGDILIGEHLGGPSNLPWSFRYSNSDALAPSTNIAYQPGPLYESVLGLIIFVIIWPQRSRFQRPGTLVLAFLALYAVGRFATFFLGADSHVLVFGLGNARATSTSFVMAALRWSHVRPGSRGTIAIAKEPRPRADTPEGYLLQSH